MGGFGSALLAPLGLAAWAYGAGARLHRASYTEGWGRQRARQLPCRVVSVGSLTLGGSGKTPLAAWLAGRLCQRGHRVALATRGYGRRSRDAVHVLTDGRRVRGDVLGNGDEPLVLASHAPGVPVLVGRDRGLVGLHAVATFGTEVLVLDDGFQHHRLFRDVDLVTLDGGFGFGNGRVLPRGPLRERPEALAHAHAVAVIDGPLDDAHEAAVSRHAVNPVRIRARREAESLRSLSGGASLPPAALAGMRVGVLAGIGQPAGFARTLASLGATLIAHRTFPDHHRYRPRDLKDLHREADVWVTTEKDAVKILPGWTRADLRVLRIELRVQDETSVVDWLESFL